LIAAWAARRRLAPNPLTAVLAIAVLFYAAWFLGAAPQRVRHLLPIYAIGFVILWIAAVRGAERARALRPLIVGMVAVLALQFAGAALYALAPIRYLASGQGREAFLRANLNAYDAAVAINRRLGPDNRVLLKERQVLYYLDVPYFLGETYHQALVNLL